MITKIETVRPHDQPNLLLVEVEADDGLTGLGESYFGASVVYEYIHSVVAPVLLGTTNAGPEWISAELTPYTGFQGSSTEVRGNSAIDVALWDLLGKRADLPLAELLGGDPSRTMPIYNTCAGPGYVESGRQRSGNWGLPSTDNGSLEDLWSFFNRPGALAQELLDEGIGGMKIWPFDLVAERCGGHLRDPRELRTALGILDEIRSTVGDDMQLMVELHGLWDVPSVIRIARELERFDLFWLEDPLRPDCLEGLRALGESTSIPIAIGETAGGLKGFKPLLATGAVAYATPDILWSGGLGQARKVAALAEAHSVPIAPHDCTGPVALATAVSFCAATPNAVMQETCRAFIRTWYTRWVDGIPCVVDGRIGPTQAAGHGVTLRDDIDEQVIRRSSTR